MNITIAGAGAMGSRFGLMLHEAGNHVVFVDGWKEHVDAINKNGLQVNHDGVEKVVKIPAYLQDQVPSDFKSDLIILFTKSLGLEGMLHSLKDTIDKDTRVLCLLNGFGHDEKIKKYVPEENIYIGNTMWTSDLEGPGMVKLMGWGTVNFKNWVPGHEESAHEIAKVLSDAGLGAEYTENILEVMYKKICLNATLNCMCALLECNAADFGDTSTAHTILTDIITEFAAVAKAEGVNLDAQEAIHFIETKAYNRETLGLHYPSMHQDLIQNNRLTEIDSINGAIAKKGRKYGIPTPYSNLVTNLIHAKEELRKAK